MHERLEPLDTMLRDSSDDHAWQLCAETPAIVCLVSIARASS
jgi:hypothetical protein